MARISNIKLRRSATQGSIPTTANLDLGELAINTYDGKLYVKKSFGGIDRVAQVGSSSYSYNLFTGVTETLTVTVASSTSDHRYNGTGSSNKYFINGLPSPYLKLVPGTTYRFDVSDSSNSGHPFRFYYEASKTTSYTTGVTTNGTAGQSGAYVEILATDSTPPVLHYQCSAHANMGNQASFSTRNLTGFDTDDLSEGSTNLYYTDARADARIALQVGANLDLSSKDTDDLSEGSTNLYYTDARARGAISVTDAGGDGSLAYNSGTGVITYTGPSASETRAHFSGGTGVTISSGVIAIGQAVATTDDVTFNDVTVSGDLTVNGTTTTLNTATLDVEDKNITLNAGSGDTSGSANGAGITIQDAVNSTTDATILWDQSNSEFDFSHGINVTGTVTYGTLNDGTTALTSTVAELNYLDGVTGITLGSANELLIVGSDGTSIVSDGTLTIDPSNNYVGINQTSPAVTLHMTGEGAQTAQIRMEQYNNSADAPDVRTRRYRGTISSPSAVQSGDYLFRSNHEYYNGTSLLVGGAFAFDNTNNAARTQFSVAVDTDGTGADPAGTNGQFKIDGNDSGAITFNNAYKFPTSDGSSGQVLQTDGSGNLSFATVSSGGSTQNLFETIAVSGQSDVVADSATDTLTLAAGSGMTITTDASTDTITFASSGGSSQSAVWTEYVYTATASQTTFSGSDDNSNTLSYTPLFLQVFLNGVLLDNGTDYTATSGTSVVLVNAAASGDLVQIATFVQILGTGDATTDEFTGDGSTVAYTLSVDPDVEDNTMVFVDGVYQEKATYSTSGTTLTFSAAPANGQSIEVVTGSRNVTVDDVSGLTIEGDLTVQGESFFTGDAEFTGDIIGQLRGPVSFKAQAGENISKGEAVYISGISGNTTVVSLADADDSNKMPAFGIAGETATSGNPIDVVNFGALSGLDTSSFSEGDELFISTTAGALTDTAPTGESSALQKIAKVTRSDNSAGSITIMGAGRSNAVPNLNTGRLFVGNASNQAVADGTLYVDIANSRVGVNTTSPAVSLDLGSNTDALRVPNGATGDRPTAALGQLRYNTTTGEFEGYAAGAWGKIGGGGDSFGTVAVSGQSDVVAEQENDTLTLVGQNGVTITTTAGTDTITIDGNKSINPFVTDLFTGDGSTTAFTLSTEPSTEDNLIVFVEGVYQNKNSYVLSGTTLTLDGAPANSDELVVHIIGDGVVGGGHTVNEFTGDGSTTDFTLTLAPMNENNTLVYLDGVYQHKSEYSVSGTTLSFSTAPANADDIEVLIPTTVEINQPGSTSIDNISQFDTTAIIPNEVTSTTVATTSATTIASHAIATYRTVKYLVQCTQGTDYHSTEINAIHDGTTVYITEYGTLFDNAALGTFDATISGGNLLLQITAGSATSMTVKVISTAIPV